MVNAASTVIGDRATKWRKSSRSATSSGCGDECVELAGFTDGVGVRDSKLGDTSPIIGLDRPALKSLLGRIKADEMPSWP